MTTKEILFIFFLIFACGFIASEVVGAELSPTAAIPFMSLLGAFIGVIFNRMKHIDDLNLARKKDVSLEYVKLMSEYRSVVITAIDPKTSVDDFNSNLSEAAKNMIGALDKLHVVSNDQVSSEIELINFRLTKLMLQVNQKSNEFGEDKISLIQWFITDDIGSKLNDLRYEVIYLINSEIGDESGTKKLKSAIEKNNKDFKQLINNMFGNFSS